ncbi:MAG TPA: hypothetical protein HA257_07355 [Candidatus Methanoperedenaceae archaeon]|nr:hypothetical protein [Candidatus Methanoperedenaceae archaeon]
MAITIWSARDSKVMVDSTEVEGLQSIEYKVNRTRSDVVAIGQPLRQGVEYGVKVVTGTLRVKSTCPPLDEKLAKTVLDEAKFTLQAQLKKGDATKTVTFQECYLDGRDYSMDVNGVGIASYTFSATDIEEA